MKRPALLVLLIGMLCFTGTAGAFQWHLSMKVARHENEHFARTFCEEESECTGWNGSHCKRSSESRIDCIGAWWYPAEEGYEDVCSAVLHWGVNHSGYVVLKRHGPLHCERVA